jgi:hypothetical protein
VRPRRWLDVRRASRSGAGTARVVAVCYASGDDTLDGHPGTDRPLEVELAIEAERNMTVGSVAVTIYSRAGTKLINADSVELGRPIALRRGRTTVRFRIRRLHLNPGVYRLGTWLANVSSTSRDVLDYVETAFEFDVAALDGPVPGSVGEAAVPCEFEVADERA